MSNNNYLNETIYAQMVHSFLWMQVHQYKKSK